MDLSNDNVIHVKKGQVEYLQFRKLLEYKDIPAWIDFWGKDVNHDWNWWQVQLPYFLNHILKKEGD